MLTSIDNTIVIIFIPKASIYCLLFLAVYFIPYITRFFLNLAISTLFRFIINYCKNFTKITIKLP